MRFTGRVRITSCCSSSWSKGVAELASICPSNSDQLPPQCPGKALHVLCNPFCTLLLQVYPGNGVGRWSDALWSIYPLWGWGHCKTVEEVLEMNQERPREELQAQGAGGAVGRAGARLAVCEVDWGLALHKKGLCVPGRGSALEQTHTVHAWGNASTSTPRNVILPCPTGVLSKLVPFGSFFEFPCTECSEKDI